MEKVDHDKGNVINAHTTIIVNIIYWTLRHHWVQRLHHVAYL